jgi:uroporphyrinogen decarboxylase
MTEMTTRERMTRMYEHREADRVPIFDFPWDTTIERWQREGLPAGMRYEDFLDIDRVFTLEVDNSPRYEKRVIEETGDYRISTTEWGVTLKKWKHMASTPHFVDFTIKDPDSWRRARERMIPTRDRIPWDLLKANYRTWRERGDWIEAVAWFGFDVTHSWAVGTERFLMALVDNPEWCMDMFAHFLEVNLALLQTVWDEGYRFDAVTWYDDLGYKGNQFISLDMYRELLKPYHRRVVEWADRKGLKTRLHSCGDIRPFIPEWIEIGVDALNPLEVKAGVDPLKVKEQYGKDLVLHGGINAVLWDDPDRIAQAVEETVPKLKEHGGYIFATDHSVPDTVSLKDFRRITDLVKKVGAYN